MNLFSNTSPFDSDVEKATLEEGRAEDWGSIIDICDKVRSEDDAKNCLKSIVRRLNHSSPHVALKAIKLLDACVCNCGIKFHLEVASRNFQDEYKKLLKKYRQTEPKISEQLLISLKKWSENEFKEKPELSLIPDFCNSLKKEGFIFPNPETSPKVSNSVLKNPDAATSQKEVDDIAMALEMSLKETVVSGSSTLYPSTDILNSTSNNRINSNNKNTKEKNFVKALYDFEAAEDNELTFYAGDIVEVLDNSDKNWWKGSTRRGEGLFPANFVTNDLTSAKTENSNQNQVIFNDTTSSDSHTVLKPLDVVVDEKKIDKLLHLLHEANPMDDSADTKEMLQLEDEINSMCPQIDSALEKVDRKHAQLTQLSINLVDALNLYHSLMKETFRDNHYGISQPGHNLPPTQPMMFNNIHNGVYSMPSMISDQYSVQSLTEQSQMASIPMQGPSDVNQQGNSHHFVPIATVPAQLDNFHPTQPNIIPSHQFRPNIDQNIIPMHYGNLPNHYHSQPQQMSAQNFYQPVQQVPLESTSPRSNVENSSLN